MTFNWSGRGVKEEFVAQWRNLLDTSGAKVNLKHELFSVSGSFHVRNRHPLQAHFTLEETGS